MLRRSALCVPLPCCGARLWAWRSPHHGGCVSRAGWYMQGLRGTGQSGRMFFCLSVTKIAKFCLPCRSIGLLEMRLDVIPGFGCRLGWRHWSRKGSCSLLQCQPELELLLTPLELLLLLKPTSDSEGPGWVDGITCTSSCAVLPGPGCGTLG